MRGRWVGPFRRARRAGAGPRGGAGGGGGGGGGRRGEPSPSRARARAPRPDPGPPRRRRGLYSPGARPKMAVLDLFWHTLHGVADVPDAGHPRPRMPRQTIPAPSSPRPTPGPARPLAQGRSGRAPRAAPLPGAGRRRGPAVRLDSLLTPPPPPPHFFERFVCGNGPPSPQEAGEG